MILYLIKPEQYYTMILPERVKGRYWLKDHDSRGNERDLISIEAVGNEWILKSNRNAAAVDANGQIVKNIAVRSMSVLNIRIANNKDRVILFADPITPERGSYQKYVVREPYTFKIGRDSSNDIIYHNEFVSSQHAVLSFDGTNWSLQDQNSTNGTYVNGLRTISRNLEPGDSIFIMGLKIIVGKHFFAINNPDGNVQMQTASVQRYVPQKPDYTRQGEEASSTEIFFRSPRLIKEIIEAELKIDPPPEPSKVDKTPIGLVIGPSITMGMASASMGVFSVINVMSSGGKITQALPMVIMAGSMLLGTILWPILTRRHEKKERTRLEAKRQQKYLDYLQEIKDEIKRISAQQESIIKENIVTLEECIERITKRKRNLWERSIGQNDFLNLRLGIGDQPLNLKLEYESKRFSLEDDNLQNAMLSIGTGDNTLKDVPIAISLKKKFNTGVIGSYNVRINLLKNFLLQLAALHSYDELKLCLIADENMMEEFSFVRCMQHFWNNEKTQRYIATTQEEARELSAELEKELLPRNTKETSQIEHIPYFLILTASLSVADSCDAFRKVLKFEKNCSVSVLSFGDELKDLPKEVKTVVDLSNASECVVYDKDNLSGQQSFKLEKVQEEILPSVARELANIQLDLESQKFALPNMMTFMEMFQVGKIEHLNCLTRWKENNPTKTLQTPIGVGTTGELFMLDLHEKFHGPHGLVAGMTGSGKSEFIITYILSLAVNYHPNEVAFILIDYKGGGLAGAFEDEEKGIKLPHLAGTITNLDGAAVNRSLISIQSELRRRQAIFNEARRVSNEGTMDIYKYQQLYRQGVVTEPVPHLFIISDEFAELKTQQPEFMEQLISAARIGRSLGVHLILATQKPSGVVDDQIWSNSKFRVCLKVQEKADSQEMIKCPDAAELSQTGRFYLQVGFNELFALGQSAWCGAEYTPTDSVEKPVDDSIQVVDNLGRVIVNVKPKKKVEENKENKIKQVVGIVKYLSDLADEEQVQTRPLWLPIIPSHIYLETIETKYGFEADDENICPIIGEYDDPYNQKQSALKIPLSEDGNCLIYGSAGSGKEMFVTTLIYSLIKNYSPEKMNIYIMDFGAETLRCFEKAPHVGGVALASEEEKVINLLKKLRKELNYRKKLFAEVGGTYESYSKRSQKTIPHIVVVVNNFSVFREQYEAYEMAFQNLTVEGLKCGVYFVATATGTNSMRYTTSQNFKTVLTLQLNDPTDYSMIVGRTEGLYPMPYTGRGLIKYDKPYEFQTAYSAKEDDLLAYLRTYCEERATQTKYRAAEIPVLPKLVNAQYMMRYQYSLENVPVGVSKRELNLCRMDLQNNFIYPILSQDVEYCEEFKSELKVVLENCSIETEVWDPAENLEEKVVRCFEMLVERNNKYKDAGMDSSVLEPYDERVWILYGVRDIFDKLSDDGKDKLHTLLDNGKAIYKTHFVMMDSVTRITEFNYQNWYKEHFQKGDGIWLGDGLTDQYVFKLGKFKNEYYEEIGKHYGYQIVHNKPMLMKLLSSRSEEDE